MTSESGLPELPPRGYGNDGWSAEDMRAFYAQAMERADQDAKRYRWLRDRASSHWLDEGPITDADVDEAMRLDAIRAAAQAKEQQE